ncbi:unnamed protein product [Angiostrongylus costaricensis]|uniref:Intraflagellar transport protein 22 homolog n=1 Tax=Angiostrongylus costaricensis TaxID=334426 RepID=A0A158PEJ5_ANGCS|nr:unnamed protein product [Angiostrongylus costaricensis]
MSWQAVCCVISIVRKATADSPDSLGRGHKTAKPEGLMSFFRQAGKTAISNYLGEQIDIESLGEYRPTKGVRIVEFESHELDIREQRIEIDVELWDCSGDTSKCKISIHRYRDCWPAIREGIEGVILVANPDENKGEDLKIWYQEFIAATNLDPGNVLIVLNEIGEKRTNDGAISEFRLPPQLSPAVCAACNLRNEGEQLRLEFNQFLVTIIAKSEDQQRNDE